MNEVSRNKGGTKNLEILKLTEELVDLKNIFRGVILKFKGYHLYCKPNKKKKKSKRESYINLQLIHKSRSFSGNRELSYIAIINNHSLLFYTF